MLVHGACYAFLLDLLEGLHQPADEYRIALIRKGVHRRIGPDLAYYSELGEDEAAGPGYEKGGLELDGRHVYFARPSKSGGRAAVFGFDSITLSAALATRIEGALIYNKTRDGRTL